MNADLVVKNSKCRLCDRQLVDESDLWAGRCNNDGACSRRQATEIQLQAEERKP
jgi:NAD-dependent DNA ligase